MPSSEPIVLTEAERIAKEHFLLHYREGAEIPCDIEITECDLPPWYDEIKYKRGQQYFQDNRLGILNSNLIGLITLLAEPRGLQILSGTGRSGNKETARKRYLSTIVHTLSWYEVDLTPNSKSRKSLSAVRKMHYLASKSSEAKNIGAIKQTELAFTAFGFMGFPLIRPHLLGIRSDNREDREAFVHVWAILCYMIGVKDKFNICLLPMDALEVMLQMIQRYLLIPILQVETPLFREMAQAMLDGMSSYLPILDYDAQVFTAKLICGVPGYQYGVDLDKEKLCRSILTQSEIDECNEILWKHIGPEHIPLSFGIPVLEIRKIENYTEIPNDFRDKLYEENSIALDLHRVMGLKSTDYLTIKYINYEEEWRNSLNDSKFHLLNSKSQSIVKTATLSRTLYQYSIFRYVIEWVVSALLNKMRRAQKF